MPPPIHITGAPNADWLIFVVGLLVCLYWLRALRLAREGARLFIGNLVKAVIIYAVVIAILRVANLQIKDSQQQGIAVVIAFIAIARFQSEKRSRYISKSVRRAVIARDLKGEKFDPAKHHVDHVWPFARGGSHTVDNLRVIEKKTNLRKGAKRPRMRDMWR